MDWRVNGDGLTSLLKKFGGIGDVSGSFFEPKTPPPPPPLRYIIAHKLCINGRCVHVPITVIKSDIAIMQRTYKALFYG